MRIADGEDVPCIQMFQTPFTSGVDCVTSSSDPEARIIAAAAKGSLVLYRRCDQQVVIKGKKRTNSERGSLFSIVLALLLHFVFSMNLLAGLFLTFFLLVLSLLLSGCGSV